MPDNRPDKLVFTVPDLKPMDEAQISHLAEAVLMARAVKLKIASQAAQIVWTKKNLPALKTAIAAQSKACDTLFEKYVNLEKALLGKMGMALNQAPEKIIAAHKEEGAKLQTALRGEITAWSNKLKKEFETQADKMKA